MNFKKRMVGLRLSFSNYVEVKNLWNQGFLTWEGSPGSPYREASAVVQCDGRTGASDTNGPDADDVSPTDVYWKSFHDATKCSGQNGAAEANPAGKWLHRHTRHAVGFEVYLVRQSRFENLNSSDHGNIVGAAKNRYNEFLGGSGTRLHENGLYIQEAIGNVFLDFRITQGNDNIAIKTQGEQNAVAFSEVSNFQHGIEIRDSGPYGKGSVAVGNRVVDMTGGGIQIGYKKCDSNVSPIACRLENGVLAHNTIIGKGAAGSSMSQADDEGELSPGYPIVVDYGKYHRVIDNTVFGFNGAPYGMVVFEGAYTTSKPSGFAIISDNEIADTSSLGHSGILVKNNLETCLYEKNKLSNVERGFEIVYTPSSLDVAPKAYFMANSFGPEVATHFAFTNTPCVSLISGLACSGAEYPIPSPVPDATNLNRYISGPSTIPAPVSGQNALLELTIDTQKLANNYFLSPANYAQHFRKSLVIVQVMGGGVAKTIDHASFRWLKGEGSGFSNKLVFKGTIQAIASALQSIELKDLAPGAKVAVTIMGNDGDDNAATSNMFSETFFAKRWP